MIEVRIARSRIDRFDNEVLKGQVILNTLRAAGVPVIGVLFPRGIGRGTLSVFTDEMFDEDVYQWDEGAA